MTQAEYIKYQRWSIIQKATGLGLAETIGIYNKIIKASRSNDEIDDRIQNYIQNGTV